MEKSRAIIESRVNALGASEATVQVQGNDQILVQIPGLSDPETALATIGKTGKLEFARADSFTEADDQAAIKNGTYMRRVQLPTISAIPSRRARQRIAALIRVPIRPSSRAKTSRALR